MQSKKAFWKLGIDCQDVYEVGTPQGHNLPLTVCLISQ